MKKILPKFKFISTFDKASIIRKFSVLFLTASIIPLVVMFATFVSSGDNEFVTISKAEMGITMFFVSIGILAAFVGMRAMLVSVIQINGKDNKGKIDVMLEQSEIEGLKTAFADLQKKLDKSMKDLESLKK